MYTISFCKLLLRNHLYFSFLSFFISILGLFDSTVIASLNNMSSDSSQIALFTKEAESCRVFASMLFKTTAEEINDSENIILSPLSVHVALAYLSHGARGNTANEMMDGLSIHDNDQLQIGYRNLLDSINSINKNDLTLANSLFFDESVQLASIFSSLGTDFYHFELSKIDFSNNIDSVKNINDWVMKKTNNKIIDVIKSDDLKEDMKLILINAIYFKGPWQHPFDPEKTTEKVFHISPDISRKVPMMSNKQRYVYGRLPQQKFKFLEIPYTNENLGMVIILPNEIDGLPYVEKNFDWNLIVNAEKSRGDVILHLPKFKIECTSNFNGILQKMGFQDMFTNSADFNGISETSRLKVSQVVQKAFIEVNEEGSEAAAATVVKMRLKRSLEEPAEFNVNRPFLIAIRHIPTNIPLFIGRVNDIGIINTKEEL